MSSRSSASGSPPVSGHDDEAKHLQGVTVVRLLCDGLTDGFVPDAVEPLLVVGVYHRAHAEGGGESHAHVGVPTYVIAV